MQQLCCIQGGEQHERADTKTEAEVKTGESWEVDMLTYLGQRRSKTGLPVSGVFQQDGVQVRLSMSQAGALLLPR